MANGARLREVRPIETYTKGTSSLPRDNHSYGIKTTGLMPRPVTGTTVSPRDVGRNVNDSLSCATRKGEELVAHRDPG
jgi:hypothetical protein